MVVTLTDEKGVPLRLPDPAGGTFDAAGDFDRLLGRPGLTVWSSVEPYGDSVLGAAQMPALLEDIQRLAVEARSELERRGLDRLRVMAETCRSGSELRLHFGGD
jgi:hypothetical protein